MELVLLRNCTYPNVTPGEQAVALLNALNRKKQASSSSFKEDIESFRQLSVNMERID